jgi:hypothetical protein
MSLRPRLGLSRRLRVGAVALAVVVPGLVAVASPAQAAPMSPSTAGHAWANDVQASPSAPSAPPGFHLTWKDDFNGAAGKSVEPGKWIYDTGTGYGCSGCPSQWGTGEVETMTDSPSNVSMDGQGDLLITPQRDASGNWTSGRIETRRDDFTAGSNGILLVQAAIQLPQTGPGLGATGYWPSVGEIDIMENINGRPTAYSTLHCGVPSGGPCNETSGIGGNINNSTLQDGFHVYAMELDKSVQPNQLRFYLDGNNFFTISSDQVPADVWQNATDHGFFIILDVAMGGGFPWAECNYFPHPGGCQPPTPWPGVTSSTVPGASMKGAYVAVYNSIPGASH